jgi:hypothetical protein
VWAIRRAFGDDGWSLAEIISYSDDQNRLDSVWERDDANEENPSSSASIIGLSNALGYREWKRQHMFDGVSVGSLPAVTSPSIAPAAPTLPVVDASSLAGKPVPLRRWHVAGLIPASNVTLLNGDGATGKSLLALQAVVSTVAGRSWLGRPVTKGSAVFLTAEDSLDEVHIRLADIVREAGLRLEDLAGLKITSLAGADAILATPEGRTNILTATEVFAAVDAHVQATRPALVVLDTLADLFGGEENQRSQARQFIAMLRGLALRHDTAVLLLADRPARRPGTTVCAPACTLSASGAKAA